MHGVADASKPTSVSDVPYSVVRKFREPILDVGRWFLRPRTPVGMPKAAIHANDKLPG